MTETVQMLRPADIARELGLSKVRVYTLIRSGELPSTRVGGALRIPRAAWERWLATKADEALGTNEVGIS